jgi:hypothetical protein
MPTSDSHSFAKMFPSEESATGESATKVIPLNYYDGSLLMQTMVCHTMIVFDNPLDPDKLRSGLCHLAEKEGWGKIGARLIRRWVLGYNFHSGSQKLT